MVRRPLQACVCGLTRALLAVWVWPLAATAQAPPHIPPPPPPSPAHILPAAPLRDPSEQLLRDQQERERAPVLGPAVEPQAQPIDERYAPFPEHLDQADKPRFVIGHIALSTDADSALLEAREFRRIASIFENQSLGVAHINALLDRLTSALVAGGYITSRAAVSEQSVAHGQLTVRVLPGRIEAIRYNGSDMDTQDLGQGLRMALPMKPGQVLRLQDIEQAVDQLNRLRRNNAQVQISPGMQAGGSIIEITNRAADARSYSISIDNQGSSGTGRSRIQATLEQGNALGLMESLALGLVTSTETNAVFGNVSIPLGYYTLSLTRSWSEYQSLIADTALVYGRSEGTSIALNRLLARSHNSKLALDLSLNKRRSARAINNLALTPQNQTVARVGITRLSRFQTQHGPGRLHHPPHQFRGRSGKDTLGCSAGTAGLSGHASPST